METAHRLKLVKSVSTLITIYSYTVPSSLLPQKVRNMVCRFNLTKRPWNWRNRESRTVLFIQVLGLFTKFCVSNHRRWIYSDWQALQGNEEEGKLHERDHQGRARSEGKKNPFLHRSPSWHDPRVVRPASKSPSLLFFLYHSQRLSSKLHIIVPIEMHSNNVFQYFTAYLKLLRIMLSPHLKSSCKSTTLYVASWIIWVKAAKESWTR